jgi:hypothetical protein
MASELPTPVIECIEALKVFNNCTDVLNVSGLCEPLPMNCMPLPASYTVSCSVASATCSGPVAVVPHSPSDGKANVTFRIDFTIDLVIYDTTTTKPTTHCSFPVSSTITETVSLIAPAGFSMLYQCSILSYTCGPCIIANFGVGPMPMYNACCEIEFCLEFQAKFPVKLLVWTSGYCETCPCDPKQGPQLVCPPTPLYPPQPTS